jgi:hypothetical protein
MTTTSQDFVEKVCYASSRYLCLYDYAGKLHSIYSADGDFLQESEIVDYLLISTIVYDYFYGMSFDDMCDANDTISEYMRTQFGMNNKYNPYVWWDENDTQSDPYEIMLRVIRKVWLHINESQMKP